MREALGAETYKGAADKTEKLEFVHAMLGQLRRMTADEEHEMLTYLIDMACTEANDILRGARPSRIRRNQGNGAS